MGSFYRVSPQVVQNEWIILDVCLKSRAVSTHGEMEMTAKYPR